MNDAVYRRTRAKTFEVGQLVTWLYVPRGGYGYSIPVAGEVVRIGEQRVLIRVKRTNGEMVERWVSPANLTTKEATK